MTANAADLVNKGGTSSVPTYEGRIHYVKPSGASCPSGFNCFCNSGSLCNLPGSGTITGTVVIDRPGVTLDCQNRVIQAPRFGNSSQVCSAHTDCGRWDGTGPRHSCVNGFCQLHRLGGVNIGGPLNVDDAPINIDVNATSFVQDVMVRNCVIRNFHIGVNADGATFDNGVDSIDIRHNDLKNHFGVRVVSTDSTQIGDNWIHDGYEGVTVHFNWGLNMLFDTVQVSGAALDHYHLNGIHQPLGHSRWLEIYNASYSGKSGMRMHGVEAAGGLSPCNSGTATCDIRIEGNFIDGSPWDAIAVHQMSGSPSFVLSDNTLEAGPFPDEVWHVDNAGSVTRKCWTVGNVCTREGAPAACTFADWFSPSGSTCWN